MSGDQDRNIPVEAHRIMAERASLKRTIEIAGASHVVGVSHPSETADLILEAAGSLSHVRGSQSGSPGPAHAASPTIVFGASLPGGAREKRRRLEAANEPGSGSRSETPRT